VKRPHRAGTYSIVARDPGTGQLGVAVQSHWFSVGSIVTWGRAGVGVVATQSIAEPAYGPRLLDRLAAGETPAGALAAEVGADESAAYRQVAVVDAAGRVAVHTGRDCIAEAGDAQGEGFSAQANMMGRRGVWPAMARAFEAAEGPLARRLYAALEGAEAEGGDVRGRQSAALLVVRGQGEGWERLVELRVEDTGEPLSELGRLLDLADAYAIADRADALAGEGRHDEAAKLYGQAAGAAPGNEELAFWAGLGIAASGDIEAGAERVAGVIAADHRWGELLVRLAPELAPGAPAVRERLGLGP
jgi:uncharacterized Ntn-hydrolase superfamily protein